MSRLMQLRRTGAGVAAQPSHRRAERDDLCRRLPELAGGFPATGLAQWAEEFLSTPPAMGGARGTAP